MIIILTNWPGSIEKPLARVFTIVQILKEKLEVKLLIYYQKKVYGELGKEQGLLFV